MRNKTEKNESNISRNSTRYLLAFCVASLAAIMTGGLAGAETWNQSEEGSIYTTVDDGPSEWQRSLLLSFAGLANNTIDGFVQDDGKRPLGYGVSVLAQYEMDESFAIESGVILSDRIYELSKGNSRLIERSRRIHVPALARFWFGDIFAVGLGPYLSFQVAGVDTVRSDGDVSQIETSASQDLEIGVDLAATYNYAINNKTGFFVEGRYSNPLTREAGENADTTAVLVGLQLDMIR